MSEELRNRRLFPSRSRRRAAAKVYIWAMINDHIDHGSVGDLAMEEAMNEVKSLLMSSMTDETYNQAERDLDEWRKNGWPG